MLELAYRVIGPGEGHAAGRALLKELVERHTCALMPEILLTDRGKPYFAGSSLHFSISHTTRHVFCALSDKPVGIDAEEEDRAVSPKLAGKILSPGEFSQYEAAQDQRLALLTFWVLKEAYLKYLGTGLQGFPNHTDFSLEDTRVRRIDGCLVAAIQEDSYAL